MTVKHSKYKNTGILFELLVRQITADTLSGKSPKAANILKKYFVKTELGREYKLYETLLKKQKLSEAKAELIINTIIESSKSLNRSTLKRQKYNLIKEIKEHYDLEEFFRIKLPNYKTQAALYCLMEMYNNELFKNPTNIIDNKLIILEFLTSAKIDEQNVKDNVLNEFETYDKDVRNLAYRMMLEKFNSKYSDLNNNQKIVLKEFINSVDSEPKLKEFYNNKVNEIKKQLGVINKKVTDKAVQIKINEVINILPSMDKNHKIKNDDLVNLLQYYELLEELTKVHG